MLLFCGIKQFYFFFESMITCNRLAFFR